ncbi:MAG: hypothetical protein ACRD8W_24310, partial [Nitrososphaeraceae archaeon]
MKKAKYSIDIFFVSYDTENDMFRELTPAYKAFAFYSLIIVIINSVNSAFGFIYGLSGLRYINTGV